MNRNEYIDHTYLKAFGTTEDINQLIAEAKQYHFKSVCVNPTWVSYCAKALEGSGVLVCTVIGFPLGASTKETKVFETLNAIAFGANEIDMVVNVGDVKMGLFDKVEQEIRAIVRAANGLTVKVILETCYLTKPEIAAASRAAAIAGATFVKTSTGFGTGGALIEDVKLMKEAAFPLQVKASGGVRTRAEFDLMVASGATRIGTSNGVKIMQDEQGTGY
jgi:deoxyribose-phosphate aldolase